MDIVELQLKINDEFIKLELDKSAAFPFNLKATDLTNPTAVKNTYSNQITIPRTQHNNHLFSHCWKFDSQTLNFDPLEKVNFRLYVNNDIFQLGYIKLEEITPDSYKVRLFGNLGDYFNRLHEIPLHYLNIDCTHEVDASEVSRLMDTDNGTYGYALTYQGPYDKFDNDQVDNGDVVEAATWTDTVTYSNPNLDENKRSERGYAGEYRSYYQKPTIKLKSLFAAIIKKSEELGFKVELDPEFFEDLNNPYYQNVWLLCNNYKVGDISGGYGFTVKEFGDTETDRPNSVLKISKNEAKKKVGVNEEDILTRDFISPNSRDSINCPVLISNAIPLEKGDTIEIEVFTKMIATFYDGSDKDQRYRYKNTSLTCRLKLIDAKDGSEIYTGTVKNAIYSDKVEGRRFDQNNVNCKRPSNRDSSYFGEQNFAYDRQGDRVDYIIDHETDWAYGLKYPFNRNVEEPVNVRVVFEVEGNTWWEPNGSGDTRRYGVAFRLLDKSKIVVHKGDKGENQRSGAQKTFKEIIGEEHSCLDFLLSYCKLFGLVFKVDNKEDKIQILLRDNFYDGSKILDWTDRIDKSREVKLEPLAFNYQKGVFKYNELGTKYEEKYRNLDVESGGTLQSDDKVDYKEYGSVTTHTGYQIETNTFNYLDGTIFDNCIIVSDYSQYYAGRGGGLKDNKELPCMEDTSGNRVEMNGYVLLFRDKTVPLKKNIRITDDTPLMETYGTVCWNNSDKKFVPRNSYLQYLRTIVRTIGGKREVFSLNFAPPRVAFSASEEEQLPNSGIYARYWRGYLKDRLDQNSKILSCYVDLDSNDVQGDLLSKFVHVDNSLWVIDEVCGFNPLSNEPTRVKLVKVKDINNYLDHAYQADSFKVIYGGETIYDNVEGILSGRVLLKETTTTVPLTIVCSTGWKATYSSGLTLSKTTSKQETDTMQVTMPVSITEGNINFTYGSNQVTIRLIRQIMVTVTATTNGSDVTINGLSSPQQIVSGTTVTFRATGANDFLYWEINGETYTNQIVSLTVTRPTSAYAKFLPANQLKLYCDDQYTTISGVEKTGNYWILTYESTPYTFNNSRSDFTGFKFNSDSHFTTTGPRVIKREDNYLIVYYNRVLVNITAVNESPFHLFSGETIYINGEELEFECEPEESDMTSLYTDKNAEITFDRYDYHYPTFINDATSTPITLFPDNGLYNITITGHRVGWDGDLQLDLEEAGYLELEQEVYGPIEWELETELAVEPDRGDSDEELAITLLGKGGKIIQHIGGFEYTLTITQPEVKPIGWNGEGLEEIEIEVESSEEEASAPFYYNKIEYDLSEGLEAGEEETDEDGSVWAEMTATFEPNPFITERELRFTVTINDMEFVMIVKQAGADIGWTEERLQEYTQTLPNTEEEIVVPFYHNGIELQLADGITRGADVEEEDGTIWSDMTISFPPNMSPLERTLAFPITITDPESEEEVAFTLYIIQEGADLGWTEEKLLEYTVDVEGDEEEVIVPFYHDGISLELSNGLEKGDDNTEPDGVIWSEMTATFGENPYPAPRTLKFTITIEDTVFTLHVNQEANFPVEGNYWGQAADEDGVVTGSLTGADGLFPSESCLFDIGSSSLTYKNGYFCGSVTANEFIGDLTGNATSADKVNNSLTFKQGTTTVGTYNGSSALSIEIPTFQASPYTIIAAGQVGVQNNKAIINYNNVVTGVTCSPRVFDIYLVFDHNITAAGYTYYWVHATPYYTGIDVTGDSYPPIHSNSYPRICNQNATGFVIRGVNSDNGGRVGFMCNYIVFGYKRP